MIHRPQPSPYRPEKTILALGEAFYDQVEAAEFPQTILRLRNQRWAEAVGLGGLSNEEWLRHFGRCEALPDKLQQPQAPRYHGNSTEESRQGNAGVSTRRTRGSPHHYKHKINSLLKNN